MADIKDISRAIESALLEIGVNGTLDVSENGEAVAVVVGQPTGDDVAVTVAVDPLPEGSIVASRS